MGSVNKVILLGRLGADPEVRYTQDQTPVASFNIATAINYKNKSGEKVDKTSWHRCVAWRKTGEVIGQYFKKGNQIYIEGSLESRSYEDKSGEKKFITEVVVNNFQFVEFAIVVIATAAFRCLLAAHYITSQAASSSRASSVELV